MPNIAEYNATGEITPSDKGIQAAEVAGRRIGAFYHQIQGDVAGVQSAFENHMAVMESSELYKTGTELRLNLQQKYDTESALPENRNNPHFGDQFMAEVGPQLDKWGEGAGTDHGKMLAAEMKGQIRNEIFHHVVGGQSEMDAAHVHDNMTTTLNTLGAGLITDPSEANLDRTMGTAKDAIQGMTMAIPDVATRERVSSELQEQYLPNLVIARYRGVAESIKNQVAATGGETSPALEQFKKDTASQVGFSYLKPEQQAALSTLGDEAVRSGQEQFKAKDATNRRGEDEAIGTALEKVDSSLYKPNGAGGVTISATPEALAALDRIGSLPGAGRHVAEIDSLRQVLRTATQDQISGKETVTDHGTYLGFTSRIGSTKDPLLKTEVDAARAQHKLSDSDYTFLRESASDSKLANPKISHAISELNQAVEKYKPAIDTSDPLFGKIDQGGAIQFARFSWKAQEALRKAIDAGEDPEKAMQYLTDPRNPEGLEASLPQYRHSQGQAGGGMARVISSMTSGEPQALPAAPGGLPPPMKGESPAAYLKRTGQ